MDKLIKKKLEELLSEYGEVPPIWAAYPHFHPYSLGWRMGEGEDYKDAWWHWKDSLDWSEEQRLGYLHKYPTRPAWLGHIITFLWEVSIYDSNLDTRPYFEKALQLGFPSENEFEADLRASGWQEMRKREQP